MVDNTYILRYISCEDEGGSVHFGYKKITTEKSRKQLVEEFNNLLDNCVLDKQTYLTFYGVEISLGWYRFVDYETEKSFDPFTDLPQSAIKYKYFKLLKYMTEDIKFIPCNSWDEDRELKVLTLDEFLESIK